MQIDFYKYNGKYHFETEKYEGRIVIRTSEYRGEQHEYVSHIESQDDLSDEEYDSLMDYMRNNINEILNAKQL
jgi:hypothetical protein